MSGLPTQVCTLQFCTLAPYISLQVARYESAYVTNLTEILLDTILHP